MNTLIYRRVSTDRQDCSLETQEQSCLRYLAQHDGLMTCDIHDTVNCVFADSDTSGSIPFDERPGGMALLQRVRGYGTADTGIRHVIVSKLDRLGRNLEDFLRVWRIFSERNVALHIADEGHKSFDLSNKDDFLMLVIKMAVAQYELLTIRDRTRQNLQTKFNNGQLTGSVPYGYDVHISFSMRADDRTLVRSNRQLRQLMQQESQKDWKAARKLLVPNDYEQRQIRLMHDYAEAGWTYKQIAEYLNAQGVPTKEPAGVAVLRGGKQVGETDGKWKIGMVDSILRSKHTQRILEQETTV